MVALNKIHVTDALKGLKKLETESVDCIVTSPPYWAKRDYKIPPTEWLDGTSYALGLEPELGRFIQHLCDFFDEANRVLKKTGTLWVVLGDTYGGNWGNWSTVKGVHNNQAGDTTTPLSELLQQRISRKSVRSCQLLCKLHLSIPR